MGTFSELQLSQLNDEDVELTLTHSDTGLPLDLATVSAIEMYLKGSKTTDDTDPGVTKLTKQAGQIVITNAVGGVCIASIPAAALAVAGTRWWRVDVVIAGGQRKTALYGPLRISDT